MSQAMEDLPTRIADLLEDIATRVRAMTVERVQGWTKWTAVGLVLALIVILAAIYLLVGLFRLLEVVVPGGIEAVYAIVGGLFVILGMFLWSRRTARPIEED